MYRFELLGGTHTQGDGVIYKRGDTVASELELDVLHGSNKFRRLSEDTRPSSPPPATVPEEADAADLSFLDGMSLKELREYAEQEEIDLGDAKRKQDVLKVITEAVGW